jgi:LPXTG-site transpeptidase (sortase) family protein
VLSVICGKYMSQDNSKKYPVAPPEIASVFKIDGSADSHGGGHNDLNSHGDLPMSGDAHGDSHNGDHAGHGAGHTENESTHSTSGGFGIGTVAKTIAPYVLVFGVAVLVYYFFFSSADFGSWFKSNEPKVSQKETLVAELQKEHAAEFQNWVKSFYFDVSDSKVLDPNTDNSGNGLSNFHKYLLNLNPKAYDTLGLGMPDSQSLASGINPNTGSALTDEQKQVLDKYFDMEVIMNRLTLSHMQRSNEEVRVAGNSTGVFQSAEASARGGTTQTSLPVDPNFVDIDTNIPGRLEVPSLGINVPIIWTKDTANFDKDLQSGVVHYPGTAFPSQIGTAYISGHSSNYAWAKGDYNRVFAKLGNLPDNASFKITVVQKNGRDARLHYIVTRRQEYSPTDQAQFTNTGKSAVALSTCWPIGSTAKRLVVFGELSQVNKD